MFKRKIEIEKKNIAVVFGGVSVEHDVSVITGVMTLNSLDREKYNAIPIYIDYTGEWYTGKQLKDIGSYSKLDIKKLNRITFLLGSESLFCVKKNKLIHIGELACVINCLHGKNGEDGSLIGLLNMCNIPTCSPNLLCSSVAMDKMFTKIFAKGINIKTLNGIKVDRISSLQEIKEKIEYPVFVKPNCAGSSIGVSKAENYEELLVNVNTALRYDESVVIEPYIKDFIEINCAGFMGKNGKIYVSECECPHRKKDFLSFKDKYEEGEREFPANISKLLSNRIKRITEKIYINLNATGIIRIDYMIINGKIYLNEINTVPGSLSYYLFCDTLKDFSKILDEQIVVGIKKATIQSTTIKTYKTNILNSCGTKGAKHL